jgi:hypothetical protein
MRSDEFIIRQMRIRCGDPVNFFSLAAAQLFMRVKATGAGQETLTTQDFVDPCNASGKSIRRVEKGGIRVGDFIGRAE